MRQNRAGVRQSISYLDAEARLDIEDVQRQIRWYRAEGMVKPDADACSIIDMRYVVAMVKADA